MLLRRCARCLIGWKAILTITFGADVTVGLIRQVTHYLDAVGCFVGHAVSVWRCGGTRKAASSS